ncbi:MAG: hypothetical protein ABR612_05495 [Chromatocurvus sp.]
MPLLEGVNVIGLALAVLLPWLVGTAVTQLLLRTAPITLLLGYGYLIGQLLVMMLIIVLDRISLPLTWMGLVSALALIGAMATGVVIWRRMHWCPTAPDHSSHTAKKLESWLNWRDLIWLVPFLTFCWLRGSVVAEELSLRPLYAWDAWMNWVPRSVVWFEHGSLTPFAAPDVWLKHSPDTELYTLGNRAASNYPPGIPLLLLWHMLGAGTTDHTLLYIPWLLLPVAAALALWGHLRTQALGRLACAVAVYVLLSMPLPATHTALPGYADLWLGVTFAMGAMALAHWQQTGDSRYAALIAAMALLCALLKNPGLGLATLLLTGMLLVTWRPPVYWVAGLTMGWLVALVIGLVAGLDPAWVARFDALPTIQLPGALPELRLRFRPLLDHLAGAIYATPNWHLLGVLLPASLLAGVLLGGVQRMFDIALLLFVLAFSLLLFVFGFTQYAENLTQGVTFHRTLLYLAPLAVYLAFAQLAPLIQRQP